MKGRLTPTAVLVVISALISAGLASYRSGAIPDTGHTEAFVLPAGIPADSQRDLPGTSPSPARSMPAMPSSERDSIRLLEAQVQELQEAVTALTRAVAALDRDGRDFAEDPVPFDGVIDPAPGGEHSTDVLARQFETEQADPDWAARTEPLISNIFSGEDFKSSQLIYHSCKSSVCRIEVDHSDASVAENFMFQLLPVVSDEFSNVSTRIIDDAYGLRSVVMLGNAD